MGGGGDYYDLLNYSIQIKGDTELAKSEQEEIEKYPQVRVAWIVTYVFMNWVIIKLMLKNNSELTEEGKKEMIEVKVAMYNNN